MLTKQWGRKEWEEHYSDPMNFARLFDDYAGLQEQEARMGLSSSQNEQMAVIEQMIEAKLGF